jgi:predicted Zn-dependent protease
MRRFITAAAAFAVLGAGPLVGCGNVAEGVLTAAPAFFISDQQEIALGLQAAQQVVAEGQVYQDPALAAYVQRIGMQAAAKTDRAGLPWTFTVMQADEPDAFALPGGYVFLTTGIIRRMKDEAELAGVLSHEVGHVAERHSVELIQQAALAEGVQAAVLGQNSGTTTLIANVVRTLVLRGYGRSKELEADRVGAQIAASNGYDANALGDMLTTLENESGGTPAWMQPLSTHPTLDERLSGLRTTIAQLGGGGGTGSTGSRGDAQAFAAATASLR